VETLHSFLEGRRGGAPLKPSSVFSFNPSAPPIPFIKIPFINRGKNFLCAASEKVEELTNIFKSEGNCLLEEG